MNSLEKVKVNLLNENNLSEYACRSSDSIRINPDEEDFRPAYFHDIDRIIHSMSYSRYLDKTQVFTRSGNDHVTRRGTHVQFVSKIARTIGRSLGLNEDLCEAIALGHDIGHTPLGHFGESVLNEISLRELGEYFAHNIQSVRQLMIVENGGKGLNLSIQVYDGIMCHNGEILDPKYIPLEKDSKEFLREFNESYKDLKKSNKYAPMTLEGCVVRISDIIGYIGRDIEDAIIMGKIKREDIPESISSVLGTTNKEIVNTIILDIISNSLDKPYIELSEDVYKALFELKEFNYKHIYSVAMSDEDKKYYSEGMNKIYSRYLEDIKSNNTDSVIYREFLNNQNDEYINNTDNRRKVIDFIAGMTDDYFIQQISA